MDINRSETKAGDRREAASTRYAKPDLKKGPLLGSVAAAVFKGSLVD